MKHEKAREVRIWMREQGGPFYILVILIAFLIIKCLLNLNENLRVLWYVDADFLPNKITFFLLTLWVFQACIFYKRTTKMTPSGLLLALICFIVVAYFLAAYVWIWIDMLKDYFSGLHAFHIPNLNDYNIFLHWVGAEVWRKSFPWGGIVFPLLISLFYSIFVLWLIIYLDMENKVFLILSSVLCFGVTLLLISSLMEALTIMKEAGGQVSVSSTDAFADFLIKKFSMKPVITSQ